MLVYYDRMDSRISNARLIAMNHFETIRWKLQLSNCIQIAPGWMSLQINRCAPQTLRLRIHTVSSTFLYACFYLSIYLPTYLAILSSLLSLSTSVCVLSPLLATFESMSLIYSWSVMYELQLVIISLSVSLSLCVCICFTNLSSLPPTFCVFNQKKTNP